MAALNRKAVSMSESKQVERLREIRAGERYWDVRTHMEAGRQKLAEARGEVWEALRLMGFLENSYNMTEHAARLNEIVGSLDGEIMKLTFAEDELGLLNPDYYEGTVVG